MKSRATGHNATVADKVLLLSLVFLSVFGFFFTKEVFSKGSDVRIEVSGRLEYTLPISIDRTVEVAGPLGKTIVEIKGSKVRIKDSPCHNRICVHEGWIDRGAIICLPNKVMVSVTGKTDKKSEGLDGITG